MHPAKHTPGAPLSLHTPSEVLCDTSNTAVDGARMAALYHTLDPQGGRPVSANYNGWLGPQNFCDLQGVDYDTGAYAKVHAAAPLKPMISSETSSAVSDRGEYVNNAATGHCSAYDNNFPGWGQTAEAAWGGIGEPDGVGILTAPYVSGGWTWTGYDYRGEPTPYSWPSASGCACACLRGRHAVKQMRARAL